MHLSAGLHTGWPTIRRALAQSLIQTTLQTQSLLQSNPAQTLWGSPLQPADSPAPAYAACPLRQRLFLPLFSLP